MRAWWIAAIAACAALPAPAAPPAVADIAPDFALKGIDGHNLRLSEYRGEPVVLHFWAGGCGSCRESAAALDRFATTSRVSVLGVSLDGAVERAAAVATSLELRSPTLVDTRQTVARAYDVDRLPLTLLIDRDGVVRASWSGVAVDLAELHLQLGRLRED